MMKKVAVLLALLALFACTPKKTVTTGVYVAPVETITEPIHVEYGPGSQMTEMSVSMSGHNQNFALTCDVDYDVRRKDDNLFYEGAIKNMKVRDGRSKTAIDGIFAVSRVEIEPSGKLIGKELTSEVLDAKQIKEMEQSMNSSVAVMEFVEQDVKTGSVIYSAKDIFAQELQKQGFTVEGFDFEYTVSGYVWHKGEKGLLVECRNNNGKVRHAENNIVMDFAFSSYVVLRPANCHNMYAETVMEFSVPEMSESFVVEMVINEK